MLNLKDLTTLRVALPYTYNIVLPTNAANCLNNVIITNSLWDPDPSPGG